MKHRIYENVNRKFLNINDLQVLISLDFSVKFLGTFILIYLITTQFKRVHIAHSFAIIKMK